MRTRILVVLAALLVAYVPVARADRPEETPLRTSFSTFPMQLGGWQGIQLPPFPDDILQVLGLDEYVTRNYRRDDRREVNLYIGYWKSQRQGDTMHSPQNCLPGAGWEPVSQTLLTFPDPRDPQGAPLSVRSFVIQKGIEKQIVLYWYQSHGRVVASEYWSKAYLVWDAARLNRTDAALIRVVVPAGGPTAAAEASAQKAALDFVSVLLPALNDFLPK